jgi:hypothetical protein
MRFLRIVLKGLLILIGIFIAGGFFIPPKWEVSRSISIGASAQQIYPLVSNFKEWEKWSPWSSYNVHYTYQGPESGVGSKQSWDSEKMGKGWMQLTSANPQTGITYDFYIAMGRLQSNLQGSIAFAPQGTGTLVTWTDKGDSGNSFVKRWMSVIFKIMIGQDFEKGLSNLKTQVEGRK